MLVASTHDRQKSSLLARSTLPSSRSRGMMGSQQRAAIVNCGDAWRKLVPAFGRNEQHPQSRGAHGRPMAGQSLPAPTTTCCVCVHAMCINNRQTHTYQWLTTLHNVHYAASVCVLTCMCVAGRGERMGWPGTGTPTLAPGTFVGLYLDRA